MRGRSSSFVRWWSAELEATVDRDAVLERVRMDSGWSAHFAVMTLLSAGIAILGLLLPSSAVVIGAMLISPLMGPIIGAGFGLATFDSTEIRRSLWAIVAGTVMAVTFCAAIVLVSPLQTVTSEIASRTRPNLFDLLIALLSGLAGTYAVIRGRHGAIVGVAIATALMPPIAVMGFGLATENWAVLSGSALLFFTNLMTIAAAAAALARLYGFAAALSPHQTRLQLLLLVGSLILLSIPLGLSLRKIAREAVATREAKTAIADAFGSAARVNNLQISFDAKPVQIEATVLTPAYRRGVEQQLGKQLGQQLGEPVAITVDQVRTSDGDTSSVDLAKSNSGELQRTASRIAQELALVAAVDPNQVLVDTIHKRVQVRAASLPGAQLETYRELESRVASAEPDWTITLIPPPLALPSPLDKDSVPDAVATAAWAAARLHFAVSVAGPAKEKEAVEQQLRASGTPVVDGGRSRKLTLQWQPIGATNASQAPPGSAPKAK